MRECAGMNFERCVAGHVCSDVMSAGPLEEIEGNVAMKSKELEVVKGRGKVFRDLGHRNADANQFKAILAAAIIKALNRVGLSVRGARSSPGSRSHALTSNTSSVWVMLS